MKIDDTPLNGAVTLQMEPIIDERGFFARSFCKKELGEYGIEFEMVQCNVAYNRFSHTLRGMHFQKPPFCEEKIVSCISGAIYDVIIDLNRDSSTFGQWFGITLSAENQKALYVPKGFAHGYQTLTNDASISYMVSAYYAPTHEFGVRWNDPAFGIDWILRDNLLISQKDQSWKDFNPDTDAIINT